MAQLPLKIAIAGPVYPYRAGIAHCTTRLAEVLGTSAEVDVVSFSRQYPASLYPGGSDRDESLSDRTPPNARFTLDVLNPFTWIREALRLRRERPDVLLIVWWVWVWAIPVLTLLLLRSRATRVVLQCHNIADKEPAWWKTALTNVVLRRADLLLVHAASEGDEARRRIGAATPIEHLFLPVHELGSGRIERAEARKRLDVDGQAALFFGHVRPFKGLDVALRAWSRLEIDATLLVAGEAWWNKGNDYLDLARHLGVSDRVRFDFRYIPDDEIAAWFGAADVVVAPYRSEAQSGVTMTSFWFGRPVIASAVGGIPEVVSEGREGFLVPPGDPEALARSVERFFALSEQDRRRMESHAAEAAQRYSWDEFSRRILPILERLVREAPETARSS